MVKPAHRVRDIAHFTLKTISLGILHKIDRLFESTAPSPQAHPPRALTCRALPALRDADIFGVQVNQTVLTWVNHSYVSVVPAR